jgi:hypothetical protein
MRRENMLRGKNSRVVKRVEASVMGSNVEGKKWRELNRLLDGMLVEHYAWGLVIDLPEPASERFVYDQGREWAGIAQKLENQVEPSKEAGGIPKRRGVYSLVFAGNLSGRMRGGRQQSAKK